MHESVATLAHVPLRSHLRPLSSHHGLSQRLRYSDRSTSTKEPTPCYQNVNRQGGRGGSRIVAARPHTDAPAARGRARRPGCEQSPTPARGPAAASHNPRLRLGGRTGSTYPDSAWGAERPTSRTSPPKGSAARSSAATHHSGVSSCGRASAFHADGPGSTPGRRSNERGRGPRMGRSCDRSRDTQRGATSLTPTQAGVATSGQLYRLSRPVSTHAAVAHLDRAPGSHPGEEGSGPSCRSTSTTKRGGAAACSPVS